MKNFESFNQLLETPIEKCVEVFKDMPKGELTNLQQLIKLQYEQVNQVKSGLLMTIQFNNLSYQERKDRGIRKMTEQELKETQKSIQDLYTVLQLIEDRFLVLQEVMVARQNGERIRLQEVKNGN